LKIILKVTSSQLLHLGDTARYLSNCITAKRGDAPKAFVIDNQMATHSEQALHSSPFVELLKRCFSEILKCSKEMNESGLPHTQLKLMQQIWYEHAMKIKSELLQTLRESILCEHSE
jgi:hypothetical protein